MDGQPIGGDQDHGHNTEIWELGWFNPGQDYSMHHGRVGHSCDGLMHQAFVHPISHGYSVWGFILTGGLPHFLYLSVRMLPDAFHELHSSEAERPASRLSVDLPGDMEFCD